MQAQHFSVNRTSYIHVEHILNGFVGFLWLKESLNGARVDRLVTPSHIQKHSEK